VFDTRRVSSLAGELMNKAQCDVAPFLRPGEAGTIVALLDATVVTAAAGNVVDPGVAVTSLVADIRRTHDAGFKLILIGIGADAGSASHLAIDFSKNGNVRALSFDAAAAVTCLGNDLGFERIFAKQIELHGRAGDIAIVIGGRGADLTMLNAATAARQADIKLITTSASSNGNPLSALGDLNFRIPVDSVDIATIAQLALCHSWVDFLCGWRSD
jgi:D-sedoheptulose 7-phosphate isomerase